MGIETARQRIRANEHYGGPNAYGLSQVVLPPEVKEVFIYADHDENGTGQQAAQTLASRLAGEGRAVRILLPAKPGWDWLDVWNASACNDSGIERRSMTADRSLLTTRNLAL